MALNKKQASLLRNLIDQGILDKPNIRVRNLPKLPPLSTLAPVSNQSSDYASYLLANAVGSKGVGRAMSKSLASTQNAEEDEKSVLGKIFDTLSIPNYMMADIGNSIAEGMDDDGFVENLGDTFGGTGKAIAEAGQSIVEKIATPLTNLPGIGDNVDNFFKSSPFHKDDSEKRTFEDVLHNQFGVDNKIARYGGGFGLDLATDPLSFLGTSLMRIGSFGKKVASEVLDDAAAVGGKIPGGNPEPFVKKPMPQASVAEQAMKGNPNIDQNIMGQLPEIPKIKLPDIRDPSLGIPRTRGLRRKQQQQLPGLVKNQDKVTFPARNIEEKMVRRQVDFERAMTAVGKVADSPSKINMRSVNNVIHRIQAGDLPRVLPKVPSATGDSAVAARDIADDFVDALMGQKKNIGKKVTWRGPSGKIQSRKLPPEMTAGQQIAMFGKILGTHGPKNLDNAIAMLRSSEDHLISLGVHPIRHEGVRVRLSDILAMTRGKVPYVDVINDFNKKSFKNMNPAVREAIQAAAAYRTVAMSDILENATKYAEKARRSVADNYVGRQAAAAEDQIVDGALAHIEKMGATKEELKAALNLVKDVVNLEKLPAENFLMQVHKELEAAVLSGKVDAKIIDKFNNMVADSLGITKNNIASKITGSNVVDQVMTSFATWWGKGALLNPAKGTFDAGMRNAQARAEMLRKLSKEYTSDEIKNAWKIAAGNGAETVADPRTLKMAGFFREYMDHVLKVPSYGMKLNNAAIKHLSVVERSQMMMRDVNRHLKEMNGVKSFQFTDASLGEKARDAWGMKRNFGASGEGWAASWARWNPDDPLKTLYDIDLALERATKEYAFLDNFVFTFGSLERSSVNTFKMPLARIADFYVPEDVGRQMLRVMSDIHKGQWTPNSPLGRFHGKALRVWKTGVTIYLPSHHIRNGIGDTYLMWLAGHNNPYAFVWGKRIMHSQKGRYNEVMKSGSFDDLERFTGPEALKWADTNGKDVILHVKGTRVTAEQLYANAWHRGLLKDANQLEDIFGESRIGFKPLGGKVHNAATGAAEYREHYIRLSHFTSAVNKSLKSGRKDLDSIFDDAAAEVRKWHPDGTDLTRFEQKYMRNIVPFYSWIRKSTPLLVESMVTRPAKTLAYPRGMVALQNMMGIESSMADPFPDDQLFPEWIRGYGIGPIGDAESDNPFTAWWGNLGRNMMNVNGDPYGYSVVNPSNPFIDMTQQFAGFGPKDTARGVMDSLTPFLKVPMEIATDSQFTGAPIYKDSGGQGLLHYLSKQLPMTAPVQRITDFGDKPRDGKEPGMDIESLINQLTALGLHGTAPYIKTAEFEKKEKLRARNNQ